MANIFAKLKYETSVITFVQFIAMSTLYFTINLGSIVATCTNGSNECLSNTISSITLSIIVVFAFALVWILGYLVQNLRSHRLAIMLIVIELGILVIEIFDAHNSTSVISLITSTLDAVLAFWIITLAIRVYRAKGSRIVIKSKQKNKN